MRPNIILIMTDQQRFDTIGALGASWVATPNLDQLVREGVTFTNCHITGASCVPSRASLFKGYYPHTTGIISNNQNWQHSWVELLAAAGYHCASIGKMHTKPFDAKAGFHERYVIENKDRFLDGRWFFDEWDKALASHQLRKPQRETYRLLQDYRERLGAFVWELPERLHSDVFVGDMACWWIERRPVDKPLFLQIGFPGPHPPYDPVPRALGAYVGRNDIPIPDPSPGELAALPAPLQHMRQHDAEVDHDSVVWSLSPTQDQLRRLWAHFGANVTMIDEKIGDILAALGKRGYLDNAVIIFASDHGDCMGEHGLIQKLCMYDCVTRTPLIIRSNGWSGGGRIDDLCQLFDVGPTILELAGVEVPPDFEARSLSAALHGREWTPRRLVFCEQGPTPHMPDTKFITMVRSARHKLVHYAGADTGQLFDLLDDPVETRNRWHDAAYLGIRQQLSDAVRDWLIDSNCHTRNYSAAFR